MKILDKRKIDYIYDTFEFLDDDNLSESNNYDFKLISVFDHALSEEEFLQQKILFYSEFCKCTDNIAREEYINYHDRLLSFYVKLYNFTPVYGRMIAEAGPDALVEFDNIEEYKLHIIFSIREQLFLKIIVPELHTVIRGNYDLTHLLWIQKFRQESQKEIKDLISKSNLFILGGKY
jgi:hypothetical protein